ncbi:MAG: DEAD/DEAH box helicase [Thermoplasmata archaeon]|nr:DEAD/DEAH box helicase [Thermoplasmata archaeon]
MSRTRPAWPPLSEALAEAVRARGFVEPTEIQHLAFPVLAHANADVLLVAPTGTGKTEAALLPLLDARLRHPEAKASLLYVTPLRALNRDLEQRLVGLAREVGLTAGVRHGDTSTADRNRQARKPPDVLLTTPETLTLLLTGSRLRVGLQTVATVIVDEVHELFPSDRGAQLSVVLERLDALLGRRVRRVGLSATVSNPEEVARFLSPEPREVLCRVARQPRRIEIEVRTGTPTVERVPADLQAELKADVPYLRAILGVEEEIRAHKTTLVFVNTRPTAEGLGARLRRLAPDLPVAVHHGSLSRPVREEAEVEFREGRLRALVATSSLELGIDVGSVDRVVQFGSPHQASRLLQRVGRSGHRLDRTVSGVLLALDPDDLEEAAVIARRALAGEIEPTRWRTRNRLALAQQVVATLWAEKKADVGELFRQLRHAACAQDLEESEWEELLSYLEGLRSLTREGNSLRPARGTLERFHSTLSLIPEQKTYRLRDLATRRPIGTLDERFVVTQVLAQPELLFLLHGRTWRVVEFRDDELLVETVQEIGEEPRWVGEDLPVPFEAAQEIGALRRSGSLDPYPLTDLAREELGRRLASAREAGAATDQRITLTPSGRVLAIGACFGNRTNATLAIALSGLLASRLGGRVEVLAVEPTWIVLGLPVALDSATIELQLHIPPEDLEPLVRRLVPSSPEYRYVFLNVARKFGVLPVGSDPRALRDLEPLIERSRTTPLGEEALEKTLHERFDLPHAREVLEGLRAGTLEVHPAPTSPLSDQVLARLRWRELPDTPPPTLLAAIGERLRKEPLTLVCLRCGFTRTSSAEQFPAGGAACRLCHGALSAVLSPRRTEEIDRIRRYVRRRREAARRGGTARAKATPRLEPLLRSGYTSAELVAHYGARALLCLAARGVGPETAKRLLERPYRDESELLIALTKAERQYARTRSFWA